jgi:hypothetical protein
MDESKHEDFWREPPTPAAQKQRRSPRPMTLLAVAAGILAIAFAVVAVVALLPQPKPKPAADRQLAPRHVGVALRSQAASPTPAGRTSPRTAPKPRPRARPRSVRPAAAPPSQPASPAPAPAFAPRPLAKRAGPVRLSLTSYFDNVGATSNSKPTVGDLDGTGSAFSVQALAAHGAKAGGTVRYHGVPFTWPRAAAGKADNVTADGQTLAAHGSGRTLSFLLTAGWGPAAGTGTVVYAGGRTQHFTIGAPDWYRNCPRSGGKSIAIFTPYRNQGNGRASFNSCVYYAAVRLDSRRDLRRIILPQISAPVPKSGEASLHIFAITIH